MLIKKNHTPDSVFNSVWVCGNTPQVQHGDDDAGRMSVYGLMFSIDTETGVGRQCRLLEKGVLEEFLVNPMIEHTVEMPNCSVYICLGDLPTREEETEKRAWLEEHFTAEWVAEHFLEHGEIHAKLGWPCHIAAVMASSGRDKVLAEETGLSVEEVVAERVRGQRAMRHALNGALPPRDEPNRYELLKEADERIEARQRG